MLGKNVQLPTMHTYGATIEVKEVFRTIQGEGPYAGSTAVFVMLDTLNGALVALGCVVGAACVGLFVYCAWTKLVEEWKWRQRGRRG